MNESLKPDYLSLYVADLINSSETLLKTIPYLSISMNSLVWSTVCAIFSKLFPYRSPKLKLDLQSQKTISLLITITISLSIQIDKFVYPSDLETTILVYFPSQSLNIKVINSFLQKLSTWFTAKSNISTRIDFFVAYKCDIFQSNYNM